MNNGVWNFYHIQNALVIIRDGRPKIVCAWFKTDARRTWNYKWQDWEEKYTEAHISVCSKVPEHIARLWTPGARADDPRPGNWGQGVEGSNTGEASSGGSGWGQGVGGSNTGAANSGGSGWGQGVGGSNTGAASSGGSGWGQGVGGSNTGAASSGSAWGQGVGESNTGTADSGGSGWGQDAGDTGAAHSGGNTAPSPESMWL